MIKISIFDCERCGQDHPNLSFEKFIQRPLFAGGTYFSYWATCPTTGEPILAAGQPYLPVRDPLQTRPLG